MNLYEKTYSIELPVKGIEVTKTFFTQLFGWLFVDYWREYTAFSQSHDNALIDTNNDQAIAGSLVQSELNPSTKNDGSLVTFYSHKLVR